MGRRRMQSTTFGFEWPRETWEAPPHPHIRVQNLATLLREGFYQISHCSSHCCSRVQAVGPEHCSLLPVPSCISTGDGWGSHHLDCTKASNLPSLQDVQQRHPNKFCLKCVSSLSFQQFCFFRCWQTPIERAEPPYRTQTPS